MKVSTEATAIPESWFRGKKAEELTHERIRARKTRRLTYDCMNAVVTGDSVICKAGHWLKGSGNRKKPGLQILSVLRGRSSSICQTCRDYDKETHE